MLLVLFLDAYPKGTKLIIRCLADTCVSYLQIFSWYVHVLTMLADV